MQSLDPSYAPWSDRHDPVESTRQFGEGCAVLATCWVDLFTTFDWGRESQAHECVSVRACVRACACARAYTYLNSRYTHLRCAHTCRSSDVGRHLLGALRDEVEPVITAHVHSLRYPAGRACVGVGLAFRLALLIFIHFSHRSGANQVAREAHRAEVASLVTHVARFTGTPHMVDADAHGG